MANFQKTTNLYPAIGAPGAFASVNPVVSTALGRFASADIIVGGFCWDDPDVDGAVLPSGTGAPLGFVARDVMSPIFDLTAEDTNIVPKGYNVNVQVKGDFFVQVPAAVAKGDAVNVDVATGKVAADGQDTGWVFTTAAEADGIAVISKY